MPQVAASDSLRQEIGAIVGDEFVRAAAETDEVCGVRPQLVVEPGTPTEVARVLAAANEGGLRVVPRGGGTKLGWGSPPTGADLILSLLRLDRVLEHAAGDMTVTVEAGCTIAALQRTVAERGQRLALDPLWPDRATVGGVLATADSGPLRAAFGPPRDLVLGVTVALADGTLARSGGKVVKNVAGYDLPKLFTGSFGTLGVVTQATFRLHPLPGATRDLTFELPPGTVNRFVAVMSECALLTAAAQIRSGDDGRCFADIRVESLPEAVAAKAERVTRAVLEAGAVVALRESGEEQWARERLFDGARTGVICKVAFPPTGIGTFLERSRRLADRFVSQTVLQTFGVGLLRLDGAAGDLSAAVKALRAEAVSLGGSLVVLKCPPELKSGIDVWGEPGDALPLMRRVKEQFDPAETLNPGRFVGGI